MRSLAFRHHFRTEPPIRPLVNALDWQALPDDPGDTAALWPASALHPGRDRSVPSFAVTLVNGSEIFPLRLVPQI